MKIQVEKALDFEPVQHKKRLAGAILHLKAVLSGAYIDFCRDCIKEGIHIKFYG